MITYFFLSVLLTLLFWATSSISVKNLKWSLPLVFISIFFLNYFLIPVIDPRTYPIWIECLVVTVIGTVFNKKTILIGCLNMGIPLFMIVFLALNYGFERNYNHKYADEKDVYFSHLSFTSDTYYQDIPYQLELKNDDGEKTILLPGRYKIGYFPDKDKLIVLSENTSFSFFPVEINGQKVEINYAPERNFNYNLKRRLYNVYPIFMDCEFSYFGLKIGKSGNIYQAAEKMALIGGSYTSTGLALVNAKTGEASFFGADHRDLEK